MFSKIMSKLFAPRYLLLTNTVSCGGMLGLGDIIVQGIEKAVQIKGVKSEDPKLESLQRLDWGRTGRLSAVAFVMGPFNHYWYGFLDRRFPGTAFKIIGKKILMDQIFASPFFAFTFFIGTGILERQNIRDNIKEFRNKFWAVYKADWTVWPAAQAVNFYFLPPQFRVVYVSGVTLAWDIFLSYVKHNESEQRDPSSA